MLNKILENLKSTRYDVDLPSGVVVNVMTLPCIQKAQELVRAFYELENPDFTEWHYMIKKQLEISTSNIASHLSESTQNYPKKKLQALNLAFQESNVVLGYLKLMITDGVLNNEKVHELKDLLSEIRHLLVEELKRIEPEIKDLL